MNKTVGISIDEQMLEDITGLAHDLRVSRSVLVCTAIEELLAKHTNLPVKEPPVNTLVAFFRNRDALEDREQTRVYRWIAKLDPEFNSDFPFRSHVYAHLYKQYAAPKEYVHPEDMINEFKVNGLLRAYNVDSTTNPWEMDGLTRAECIWLFEECKKKKAEWEGGAF